MVAWSSCFIQMVMGELEVDLPHALTLFSVLVPSLQVAVISKCNIRLETANIYLSGKDFIYIIILGHCLVDVK